VVRLDAVHVRLELRELARARHGGAVRDEGRRDLRVPVLARLRVEEELDHGALEARAGAPVERPVRAGELRPAREGEEAELLRELPVRERLEAELLATAALANLRVVLRGLPDGDLGERRVRD